MKKSLMTVGALLSATLLLAACGNRSERSEKDAKNDLKVAMVTNVTGIDDKSFNQSAWEGLTAWGKDNGIEKGKGYDYFQSASESEFATNFDTAVSNGYGLIFGIGFPLHDSLEKAASSNPDTNFVIVDDVIKDQDNVASITFADDQAAYLAGVAAAKTTKSKTVGFVGGMEGEVVSRFENGLKAGVKSIDDSIQVKVDYAGSFADAAKGKTIAAAQYAGGADVIYHAAGATGAGVFSEAKDLNERQNEADKVWVIGVDSDQSAEGKYTSKDGKSSNFVLASSIKEVGKGLQMVTEETQDGKFPGGKVRTFGLKEDGVSLVTDNLSDDAKKAVEDAAKAIVDGKVTVTK